MQMDIGKAASAWTSLAGTVFAPHTDEEYTQLVAVLDQVIDEVGEDESHPLASLMEILGILIERYEKSARTGVGERLGGPRTASRLAEGLNQMGLRSRAS